MHSGLLFLYGILRALSAKGLGARYRICIGVKVYVARRDVRVGRYTVLWQSLRRWR